MAFEIIPHTADVRLRVSTDSFADLFAEAVAALMEVVDGQGEGETVAREVKISARDRTSLLVDFLGEVLALIHINREVYDHMEVLRVTETEAEVKLFGHKVEGFGGDVKAVTYHEAEVIEDSGQWRVTLVLDV